jgi:hypothetical protein
VKISYPAWPDNIGKKGKNVLPEKTVYRFTILDEIRHLPPSVLAENIVAKER